MARLHLKNIVGKNNDTTAVILSLIKQLQATVWIEDNDGKLLLNTKAGTDT